MTAAAALKAVYDLSLGQLTCAFEYELRPAKGTVGEWAFEVARTSRDNVEVNNRAGWTIEPGPAPDAPRKLRVTLRQPGAGGKVLVSAVAPFPDPSRPGDHPLPGIRPIDANLDDEILEIRLAPELRAANWNSGDYRVTDSHILSDQAREVTLTGTLLPPGLNLPFRRLPTIHAAPAEAEFTTLEQITWRLDADQTSATVRVGVHVRRGPLFQLALKIPPRHRLARVASAPDELVASTQIANETVLVEFARPLGTGQSANFTFEFRGQPPSPEAQRMRSRVHALGAVERAGVFESSRPPGGRRRSSPDPERYPWGGSTSTRRCPQPALLPFRYHGGDPDGWVSLKPARPEFTADAETRVEHTPEGVLGTTEFTLRVRRGGLASVAILEPPNGVERRTWRVAAGGNAVAAAVPVPLSLFRVPFAIALVNSQPERLWLIRFSRPATGELLLETVGTIPANVASDSTAPDPLAELTVWGAESRVVSARSTRARPAPLRALGLRRVVPRDRGARTGQRRGHLRRNGDRCGWARARRAARGRGVRARSLAGGGSSRVPCARGQRADSFRCQGRALEVRYRLPAEPGGSRGGSAVRSPCCPCKVAKSGDGGRSRPVYCPAGRCAWDREPAADLPELLGDRRSAVRARSCGGRRSRKCGGGGATADVAEFCSRPSSPHSGRPAAAATPALRAADGRGFARGRRRVMLGPPWWQRAALVPLVVALVAVGIVVVARGHRSRLPAAVAAAVAMCVVSYSDTAAQPATPAAVVILPPDASGREVVVAPKAVLDRLAVVSRPASPGVILTAAEYTATADNTTARVTAKFVTHSFDADATASLPLADARLERVAVDGAPAFSASPRLGTYTVPLAGAGRHEIEVRFTVPVSGTGTEREFRFGVPEGPAARVVADLPGSAKQAQVVGRVGRQTVTDGPRVKMETDAGAVLAVQVRWRDVGGGTATVKIREGAWDVSGGRGRTDRVLPVAD